MTPSNSTLAITPSVWEMFRQQAEVLVAAGFLPDSIKRPEAALAIMLKGAELGLPPMLSLSSIHLIHGRPTLSAEGMLALIYDRHGDGAVRFSESTPERCTARYKRRGWADYDAYTYSIEDAKRADLLKEARWQRHPAAMLRARVITAIARMAFADTIAGLDALEEVSPPDTGGERQTGEHVLAASVTTVMGRVNPETGEIVDAYAVQHTEQPDSPDELHQMAAAMEIYSSLADKAAGLGVDVLMIPDGADLEEVQDMARSLRERVVLARQTKRAAKGGVADG
ncbi:MAG: hypothetical protein ACKVVP_07870 [Chloroflexota bacterium]